MDNGESLRTMLWESARVLMTTLMLGTAGVAARLYAKVTKLEAKATLDERDESVTERRLNDHASRLIVVEKQNAASRATQDRILSSVERIEKSVAGMWERTDHCPRIKREEP